MPTATLARLDGDWAMAASAQFDAEEAMAFLHAVGGDRITARSEGLAALGLNTRERLCEMRLRADRLPVFPVLEDLDWHPSPRALYEVLSSCEGSGIRLPAFEPWYLDLSHRMRHGVARAVLLRREERPVACAMSVAEADKEAMLGGVAVRPAFQREGLGTRITGALLQEIVKKRPVVHLIREKGCHERFYRALGFEETAELSLCRL